MRVEYAGMGPKREILGAIMSRKVPPRMDHVTVTKSAYTGVNFTLPDTFVSITQGVVMHNLGEEGC